MTNTNASVTLMLAAHVRACARPYLHHRTVRPVVDPQVEPGQVEQVHVEPPMLPCEITKPVPYGGADPAWSGTGNHDVKPGFHRHGSSKCSAQKSESGLMHSLQGMSSGRAEVLALTRTPPAWPGDW